MRTVGLAGESEGVFFFRVLTVDLRIDLRID